MNKLLLREDITPPKIVSDGKSLLLDSETAGDEPYMLASNLKDVVVLVDKDRVKAGGYAIEKFGCDTLLLMMDFNTGNFVAAARTSCSSTVNNRSVITAKCSPRHVREPPPPFPSQHYFHYEKRWEYGGVAGQNL